MVIALKLEESSSHPLLDLATKSWSTIRIDRPDEVPVHQMSSLVSDFIINPVLRQARRFSRSAPPDLIDPAADLHEPEECLETSHEVAIEESSQHFGAMSGSQVEENAEVENISGEPLTFSPIEEDGSLEAELQARGASSAPSRASTLGRAHVIPLRVAPLRSNHGDIDEDVSDNPAFGIPGRFRTNSTTSAPGTTHGVFNASMSPAEGPSRQSTEDSLSGQGARQRNGSLPEDDGMRALRQQILLVQAMDIEPDQKARLMHRLLTQGYNNAQQIIQAKQQPRIASPETMISQERPNTPSSLTSYIWQMNGAFEAGDPSQQHTFLLSPEDLKRTYAPLDPPETDEDGDVRPTNEDAAPSLGCRHYKRNVKLQCSTCEKWYTCRLCHDEAEDHVLIRKATKNMLCMLCGCAQRAGEFCVECGERTAWYYCDVCKLWDNDPNKSIYHCNDCGICRKGRGLGKDFFHCKTCGTCMSMSVEKSHKCIERVSDCDCPICGEYMFTSPSPVVFMLCGHGIHKACYDEHMKTSYKCPICSKSTVNMETQFRNLDRAIESQPMPPQFQDIKAMVSCNDCYAKSAVKYHWLGFKCAICDSYNTVQLSILSDPAVEVPTIETTEVADEAIPDAGTRDPPNEAHLGPGPARHRRHSLHIHTSSSSSRIGDRFNPYPLPQRIGRSVSPVRGLSFFDGAGSVNAIETDESADDDDLDFWGRDEPRSVTSADNVHEEMEDDEDSEGEDSLMGDCDDEEDEDGDDEDNFALIGHR